MIQITLLKILNDRFKFYEYLKIKSLTTKLQIKYDIDSFIRLYWYDEI